MAKRKTSPGGTRRKVVGKSGERIAAELDKSVVTCEERHRLISEAAYLRAERRGFLPGAELEDWLEAEAEIDKMIAKGPAKETEQV